MPCYAPLTGFYSKEIGRSGKRGITFDRNASFSGVPMKLPCGQCIGCRLERSRQWAVRCMHENMLHEQSCFVTLTYDDDELPEGGTLVPGHLSLFMKRLHNRLLRSRGVGIRYYGCGEYGEQYGRPHYHALIFGYDFLDKKYFKSNRRGEKLYTSEELRSLWPVGHNSIGAVTFDSAAYCARYIVKKVTGDEAQDYYDVMCADGSIVSRVPEFTNMSRRPGIGLPWFRKFGVDSYKWDSVVINGREVRPPRYYDNQFEVIDADRLAVLKRKRTKAALKHRKDNTPDRRRVREIVQLKRLTDIRRDAV